MVVFNHLNQYFLKRIALSKKKEHPIYILPTLNGLKVLSLNFLLLVIGLIYANNYVLLFNFLLFCLVLSSMFYTHHNLKNIHLKTAIGVSGHRQELAFLNIIFISYNKQNNFELKLKMPKSNFIEEVNFPIESLNFQKDTSLQIPLKVSKRGQTLIPGVFLETDFPLGFFRCFTFFPIQLELVLFPARISHYSNALKQNQLSNNQQSDDDLIQYRKYQLGDSFNRLNWKRFAKNGQMNVLVQIPLEQLKQLTHVSIEPDDTPDIIESKLEQAAFELFNSYQNGHDFGLMVNDTLVFELGNGKGHLEQCFKFLGLYEH